MSEQNYIYSTLSADTEYAIYAQQSSNDLPVMVRKIKINGGAGVANKHFVTRLGVVTHVDDADLALLQENKVFQKHVENGFVTIEQRATDVEKVVADMVGRDNSAPLVPEDYNPELAGAQPEDAKEIQPPRQQRGRGKR